MSNINKIISFVLGLIVVIVFVAVISGKLNIGKRFTSLTKGGAFASATPTPTMIPQPTSVVQNNQYNKTPTPRYTGTNQAANGVNTIPKTGAETALIPTAISMLFAGILLRRKSK